MTGLDIFHIDEHGGKGSVIQDRLAHGIQGIYLRSIFYVGEDDEGEWFITDLSMDAFEAQVKTVMNPLWKHMWKLASSTWRRSGGQEGAEALQHRLLGGPRGGGGAWYGRRK